MNISFTKKMIWCIKLANQLMISYYDKVNVFQLDVK